MRLRLVQRCRDFCDDVYGGMTALTVTVFLVMLVSVGMAVDFMRHETYRAELQDAVDRCVLAAAAFSQSIDAQTTCEGYLKSTSFVPEDVNLVVPPASETTGTRTITATADYEFNTFFLKLAGIPKLNVKAVGTASEAASKIEVSLVLDISTSMVINNSGDTSNTRLEVLQSSAKQFLDLVFSPVNNDRLTMSLIPFAGQVNVGSTAFNYFNDSALHSYSHCLEFTSSEFNFVANAATDETANPLNTMTTAPAANSLSQMQHFNFSKYWDGETNTYSYGPSKKNAAPGQSKKMNVGWGWCPTDTQQIEYFQTDKEILKNRIDALQTHEATGTFYGAKWGAMLLDPSAIDLTSALITAAEVDSAQSELPRAYDDDEVQKVLIIMSDGATTAQSRVVSDAYDETSDYEFWADNLSDNQEADFINTDVTGAQIFDGYMTDGTWTTDSGVASREAARMAFLDVCETAKDNGVVVFAIGFDLEPDKNTAAQDEIDSAARARADLEACATSEFFYDVEGPELLNAFSEIASTIQKLRLVN